MPKPLGKLQRILANALEQTSVLWSPIMAAYEWVYRAATILDNEAQLTTDEVRCRFQELLETMQKWKSLCGELVNHIEHFLKVSRSYWSGLFHCYDIPGLPRTNNDLEHVFGKWRHHQRRCTGRKVAPASLVVRGSVQLVAAIATQLRSFTALELPTVSVEAWQHVRENLEQHQRKRLQQRQFRQSPARYLASLEQKLLQLVLPL